MRKEPGLMVETKSGKVGRTYHNKPYVNGKVQVFLATSFKELEGNRGGLEKLPIEFETSGMLCVPETLKVLGHID